MSPFTGTISGAQRRLFTLMVYPVNNVVFSKNLITGSQVAGISANQAGGCALTGNQINAVMSGVGMDIEASSDLTITGNTVGGKPQVVFSCLSRQIILFPQITSVR